MIVYLDLIFLLNLLIDGLTLQTTAWARKIKTSPWRIVAAACIGASYVLMLFVPELAILFTFIIKCLFSLVMLYVAFGFGSLQHFFRNVATFYIVNFVAAGGIFAINYLAQSSHDVLNGMLFSQTGGLAFELKVGGLFVILLTPIVIILYRKVMNETRRRKLVADYLAQTTVHISNHCTQCVGLIDTGNQLYDPLTRTPVMVMEAMQWREFLPEGWLSIIEAGDDSALLEVIGTVPFIWQNRLRLIPYKGIKNGAQFMLALKPDKVVITHHEDVMESQKVLIGLSGSKLSADGSYQAIIHPTLTMVQQ